MRPAYPAQRGTFQCSSGAAADFGNHAVENVATGGRRAADSIGVPRRFRRRLSPRSKGVSHNWATLAARISDSPPTLTGTDVPADTGSMAQSGMMLITDHHLNASRRRHEKARRKLGPDALPYLLDALSDRTPTKLKLDDSDRSGHPLYVPRVVGKSSQRFRIWRAGELE